MGVTKNGVVEYQPREQMFNDALDMAQWGINSFGSSGYNPRANLAQQYYQNVANKRLEDEQTLRDLEMQAVSRKIAGDNAPKGEGFRGGIGMPTPKAQRGGMSPYEQELENRNRASRDFDFQQKNAKKQRGDEMSHIRDLLAEYKKSTMGNRGSTRGEEGYTEQIFNSAGAPEVVRLKNYSPKQDRTQEVDMQAIMNILMGAR